MPGPCWVAGAGRCAQSGAHDVKWGEDATKTREEIDGVHCVRDALSVRADVGHLAT